ncbi:MAG: hypothetical protein QM831_30920 [Kofleriaceae bacterium]
MTIWRLRALGNDTLSAHAVTILGIWVDLRATLNSLEGRGKYYADETAARAQFKRQWNARDEDLGDSYGSESVDVKEAIAIVRRLMA